MSATEQADARRRKAAKSRSPKGKGKLIFLFSDGTGNSSAKLQKTNVWRLYEALDLGLVGGGEKRGTEQIAFYDNGVGTSSVPLLAAMAGAFGFGLARNVRAIYSFLCRNFEDGDRILAFGFSRGAFTIRLLVALVIKMGVIRERSETDLELQVHDAWREFRCDFQTYYFPYTTKFIRWVARMAVSVKRRLCFQPAVGERLRETENQRVRPDIEFVGVWDTVAAYGGPVVELTRAIDLMVWPLSMPNFRLNEKVLRARHVLAIDDKRDSFMPLPWDEKHEADIVSQGRVAPDRLQQVFFSGMHADVGGGYADDSLGYVSLVWMLDQLPKGVRLQPLAEQRIRSMANSLGPMHDSRRGIGMLYRYQVRPIIAWLHPRRPASWPLLDPAAQRGEEVDKTMGEQRRNAFGRQAEGLLAAPIKVHCSVTERLDRGTDGYAPNNLPVTFCVVDNHGDQVGLRSYRGIAESSAWTEQTVSIRRTAYFATLFVLLVMLSMPWWPEPKDGGGWLNRLISMENDDRDLAGPIYSLLHNLLPGLAQRWTDLWVHKFWLTLILAAILIATLATGIKAERWMTDHFGCIFRPEGVPDRNAKRAWSISSKVLQSRSINWLKAWWKWYGVPLLLGSLMLIGTVWLAVASISQFMMYVGMERYRCAGRAQPADKVLSGEPQAFQYHPSHGCTRTGVRVERGKTYTIELSNARWRDGPVLATPNGWQEATLWQWTKGVLGVPYRRVIRAPYLAPIVEIVPDGGQGEMLQRVERRDESDNRWTGQFIAKRSGTLLLFLNDVSAPVDVVARDGRLRPTFLDVRTRAANNRFDDGSESAEARVWQGSLPPAITP